MCALDFQRVEKAEHIARESFDRVRTRCDGREAVSAHIVAQDAKFLRQRWNLRIPHRKIGAERIRKYEDRPACGAVHLIVESGSVRVYEGHGRCFPCE